MLQSLSVSFEVLFLGSIISLGMAAVIKLTMATIQAVSKKEKTPLAIDSQEG